MPKLSSKPIVAIRPQDESAPDITVQPKFLMYTNYWLSCSKFTVFVQVLNDHITDAAPIVRKFIGQPFSNLQKWAATFGGLEVRELSKSPLIETPIVTPEWNIRTVAGKLEGDKIVDIHPLHPEPTPYQSVTFPKETTKLCPIDSSPIWISKCNKYKLTKLQCVRPWRVFFRIGKDTLAHPWVGIGTGFHSKEAAISACNEHAVNRKQRRGKK